MKTRRSILSLIFGAAAAPAAVAVARAVPELPMPVAPPAQHYRFTRHGFIFENLSPDPVWVSFTGTASAGGGWIAGAAR